MNSSVEKESKRHYTKQCQLSYVFTTDIHGSSTMILLIQLLDCVFVLCLYRITQRMDTERHLPFFWQINRPLTDANTLVYKLYNDLCTYIVPVCIQPVRQTQERERYPCFLFCYAVGDDEVDQFVDQLQSMVEDMKQLLDQPQSLKY